MLSLSLLRQSTDKYGNQFLDIMAESFNYLIQEKQTKITELNKTFSAMKTDIEIMDKRIFEFKNKIAQRDSKLTSIAAENAKLK